jgi:catechol 2,3-dioxygenase-like lactoylglutathione lyase family enzyme
LERITVDQVVEDTLIAPPVQPLADPHSASAAGPPPSVLTHIALPVRDIDATLDFYRRYTTLDVIHERYDESTGLRSAWLANPGDVTDAGAELGIQAARFVIVLICGTLPKQITGDIKEEYGFLRSISHLGISCESREAVDAIAAKAKAEGCLLLGPMYRNPIVGYICIVTDPDGNNIEFSVEQVLG